MVTLMLGCTTTPGIKSAREGDYNELRNTLATVSLTPAQVRHLAQETLSSEVRNAKDREDRVFVRSLRACATPLKEALSKRAETHDGVGAEATLMLFESGLLDGGTSRYRNDSDGAWRAIAARGEKADSERRHRYFSDPDERVRRAALLAALELKAKEDIHALLEVSRVDPDPLCRSRAFQALARIGGKPVLDPLVDRFFPGNEQQKLAIVDAWAKAALYEEGGKRELARLLGHGSGYPALHAASRLARDADESIRNLAMARLIRFAEEGTTGEQRLALRLLPGFLPETTRQLARFTKSDDNEVALIAWVRLLASPKYHDAAQSALTQWADSRDPLAYQARAALAAAGDELAIPLMERQLRHDDPTTRRLAGRGLLRLEAWEQVAPLLADSDPGVRRELACQVLAKPMKPRFGEDDR